MKFSSILTSLAICALQVVHATPTGLEPAELETLKARDGPGYCCSVYENLNSIVSLTIPRGSDMFVWNGVGTCEIEVTRNPNNCNGWQFKLRPNCNYLTRTVTLGVRPAKECL
ncbi:hypothetical protein E4U30_001850 [Claviceps sp. LM220 group G6]|nr:hypothetical protein E4U15_004365 [Claviceps sp. LM218 group G6]KAG6096001.1 hypothetical protein E4U30_001850 [Claviceps sp. LM220 group G6]KAG6097542.1 hypothetical protein E4U31_005051 [Claviceps sp. LM219 group G6]KAG6104607.1 hypothetical protein E4U14_005624 [Claviceps sp. LM454 group G7]